MIYELQGEIVKLNNRIQREIIGKENPRSRISMDRTREDNDLQDDWKSSPIGDGKSKPVEKIERFRTKIDEVRDRLDREGERGKERLLFRDLEEKARGGSRYER